MRLKAFVVLLVLVMFAGLVSAEPELRDASSTDVELLAGGSDSAELSFVYDGGQTEALFDPLVLKVSVEGEEGQEVTEEAFEVGAVVDTERGDVDYQYGMVCTEKRSDAFDSDWSFSDFYQTVLDSAEEDERSNVQEWFCFPQNEHEVLPARTDVESSIEVTFEGDTRLGSNSFDVAYSFHPYEGEVDIDPRGETDENNRLEFEELGLALNAEEGSTFSAVTYSRLNMDNDNPGLDENLKYFRINSLDVDEFGLEVEYDTEALDNSEFEDPELYRCTLVDNDCIWEEVDAETGSGIVSSDTGDGLFGLFASAETVTETETETVTETVTETETITETETVTETETQVEEVPVNESEEPENEEEFEELDISLDMPETAVPGEEVTVQALVENEVREGTEIYLNGTLQGEVDEDGEYSFTPQEESELLVIASYNQSAESQTLTVEPESSLVGGFTQSPFNPMNLVERLTELLTWIF